MKHTFKLFVGSLLLAFAFPALAAQPVDPLDQKYGVASPPAYIKHYEADKSGKVLLHPYMQAASKDFPAILDVKRGEYDWGMDAEGRVLVIPDTKHPLGRTYAKAAVRPEDGRKMKVGTSENYGHVSLGGGAPGRIGGEILYDEDSNTWTISNKSGRYSKHNTDRTPEQLVEAAKLIREVVDPGSAKWGPVFYLIEYAPTDLKEKLLKDPKVEYDDPQTKSRPHLTVMPGGPSLVSAEKPTAAVVAMTVAEKPAAVVTTPKIETPVEAPVAPKPAKVKKPKAALNDDPS